MDEDQKDFENLAKAFMERRKLTCGGSFFYTHSSLLWPVIRNGERFMLKVVKPDDDEARAPDILHHYSGKGAVNCLEAEDNLQLLEFLEEDTSFPTLEEMVLNEQDDQATHIMCDVIAKLHAHSDKDTPKALIPFKTRSDAMRDHVEEGRVKPTDAGAFNIAYDLSLELTNDKNNDIVLHGDIHHFNIMKDNRRGWLAIDPKGIWGPRAYEYANILCNPYMHEGVVANEARMCRQAHIICERANLTIQDLMPFVFLHGMQCAAWSLYEPDQGYWLACAKTAAKLANIDLNTATRKKPLLRGPW